MLINNVEVRKKTNLNYSAIKKQYTSKGYKNIPTHLLQVPMQVIVPELFGTPLTSGQFAFYLINNANDIEILRQLDISSVWVHQTNITSAMMDHFLKEEIAASAEFFESSFRIAKRTLDNIRKTGTVDLLGINTIVDNITASVAKHPGALLCMRSLESSSEYTYYHSINVSLLSCIFAQFLGYTSQKIREVTLAGLLHDIGKQRIPVEILNAPRKLSTLEFDIMKSHPLLSKQLLDTKHDIPNEVFDGILSHHEKFDGTGYPRGLKKDEIPPYAVILSLADVYDALTSERAYKQAFPQNKTAAMIYSQKGTSFAPDMVELFICCFGVYPIGTFVKLTEEKYGIVYENNKDDLLFPKVIEIIKENGKYRFNNMNVIDLRKFKFQYKISVCENLKTENIDLNELLALFKANSR